MMELVKWNFVDQNGYLDIEISEYDILEDEFEVDMDCLEDLNQKIRNKKISKKSSRYTTPT